jgi:hypothetical protein
MPTQRAAAQRDTPREEAERLVHYHTTTDRRSGLTTQSVYAFGFCVADDTEDLHFGPAFRRAVQLWLEDREREERA